MQIISELREEEGKGRAGRARGELGKRSHETVFMIQVSDTRGSQYRVKHQSLLSVRIIRPQKVRRDRVLSPERGIL